MKKMKIAIYCRISTEEQNLDTQEHLCRKVCEKEAAIYVRESYLNNVYLLR